MDTFPAVTRNVLKEASDTILSLYLVKSLHMCLTLRHVAYKQNNINLIT